MMKYHPDTNRITDIDAGNCEVVRGIPYGGTPEEVIRNGYLFAAAEDLQGALTRLVAEIAWYEEKMEAQGPPHRHDDLPWDAIKKAERALAKAKGESNE